MGEGLLLWIQQYSNRFFDFFFGGITYLGSESFYLIILPLVYWCVSKLAGLRLAVILATSSFFNGAFKERFATARPDPKRVRVLLPETGGGYSFPSGHAQGTTTFWFSAAQEIKKRWVWVLGIITVILVAFSRMYLGLHYPVDILGGFILGLIFAFAGIYLFNKMAQPFMRQSLPVQFILAGLLPLILLIFNHESSSLKLVGNLVGFSLGALIEREWIRFTEKEKLFKQVIKGVFGLAFLFSVRMGLKAVFPAGGFYEFLRYFCIGISGSAIIPFLFTKANLTVSRPLTQKM